MRMMYENLLLTSAALLGVAAAFPSYEAPELRPRLPTPQLYPRATNCSGNTATTRSEWCDYSISTDYTSGKQP